MSNSDTDLLIGIDGGGTGCRVAIARPDLTVIAHGEGGPANATTDLARTVHNVTAALAAALEAAGISHAQAQKLRGHAGLAGVISDSVGFQVKQGLNLPHLSVTEDKETMVNGALGGQEGALAAIGTGSFVAAQMDKTLRCVGGWGFQLSDHASGAWLGKEALSRALMAHDGMVPPAPLLSEILTDLGGPQGIVHIGAQAQAHDFAQYAPRVVAAASQGDSAAQMLMRDGAAWIEMALKSVGYAVGMPLCLTGGVGPHYAEFLPQPLTDRLISPAGSALDGALRLAAGKPI